MPHELHLLLRARYPLIWLDTSEEERAISFICGAARMGGDPVAGWSQTWGLHDLPGEPKKGPHTDPLRILEFIRAEKRRTLWVLKDIGALLGPHGGNSALVRALRDTRRVVREIGSVLLCVGNGHPLPPDLAGEATVHRLAPPDRAEHEEKLKEIAADLKVRISPEALHALSTASLGLTLEQAENIWARIRALGGRFTEKDVTHVISEKSRIVRGSGFLEFIPPAGIDDVGGLTALKVWLKQRAMGFSPRAREAGLPWPRGLLLVGVQGCGKSLTAKAVAGLWNQPLLRMDVGALMEGLVGASERNLRIALELAERISPCVLWVDEIEKGFQGLDHSMDGGTISRMFGTLLTWMQEKTSPVFLLATANQIGSLPPEMLRKGRFDEIFFVDLPDEAQRRDIWRIHLDYRARAGKDPGLFDRLDLGGLAAASEGYSGAEIAAATVEGAFAALAADEPLSGVPILAALSASPPLSRTRREEITALRAWAEGRARSAG